MGHGTRGLRGQSVGLGTGVGRTWSQGGLENNEETYVAKRGSVECLDMVDSTFFFLFSAFCF